MTRDAEKIIIEEKYNKRISPPLAPKQWQYMPMYVLRSNKIGGEEEIIYILN
jgi:hypothetical protein